MTSINTTPLLQYDSENEENDIHNSLRERDDKPLFKPTEPKDKFHTVYLIFYVLGVVSLLPWNFYVTANDVSEPNTSITSILRESFSTGCTSFETSTFTTVQSVVVWCKTKLHYRLSLLRTLQWLRLFQVCCF